MTHGYHRDRVRVEEDQVKPDPSSKQTTPPTQEPRPMKTGLPPGLKRCVKDRAAKAKRAMTLLK